MEKNAHTQTADKLKNAEYELRSKDREQNEKLEKEKNAGRQEQEKVLPLEAELKTERATKDTLCAARADLSSPQLPFSVDDGPFLNWSEDQRDSVHEPAVIYRSLVATVKVHPTLDDSLEAKAVKFLEFVIPQNAPSADNFLSSHGRTTGDSSTNFVQSLVVLVSSANHAITTAVIKMLDFLTWLCSAKVRLALVKADLIPQLLISLNPQSLSFEEAKDIHIHLMSSIDCSLYLITPLRHGEVEIDDDNERQAVYETVLQQVMVPSEKYIWHLCMNRYSIVGGELSDDFLALLAALLEISPYCQPTMDFVLNMPVILSIPSCLTFVENDRTIRYFLLEMLDAQQEWIRKRGEVQQMGKIVLRVLRMEGMEDVFEETLKIDKNEYYGRWIVEQTIRLNNVQGMNLPEHE
ncbi:hypothetical protein BLNAU_16180 [Blattamonas nauphoetae]|uniref:Uncharacterized protein n=1 Tax=Blattamonas nauphoetae TaxID=2049346 RepID=A0ABQ9XDV7_9EUKA|nr:hypothetical protein BLNAU_16180 [Blattamonas nauphoetae]